METERYIFDWSIYVPIKNPLLKSKLFPRTNCLLKWSLCCGDDDSKSISLRLIASPRGKITVAYSMLLQCRNNRNKILNKNTFSDEFVFNNDKDVTIPDHLRILFQYTIMENYELYSRPGFMDFSIDITATINCDETSVKLPSVSNSNEPQSKDGIHVKQLFDSILEDADFFDITLKVGNTEFRAHKIILAAKSKVLKAAFTADMLEKNSDCIIINEFDAETMRLLITFIYNGSIEIPDHHLGLELLRASDYYDIKNLRHLCMIYLKEHVDENSALDIFTAAVVNDVTELQKTAMNYLIKNPRSFEPSDFDFLLKIKPTIFPVLLSNVFKAYADCK